MVERTQTGGWMPEFYEPVKRAAQKMAEWFAPRADAAVTQAAYEISMELPGVDPDRIEIAVQDNMVVVTGEKDLQRTEVEKSYLFSEREFGVFQRAFRIPPDADPEAIAATSRHGVLTITLPKARAEAAAARKIPVSVS